MIYTFKVRFRVLFFDTKFFSQSFQGFHDVFFHATGADTPLLCHLLVLLVFVVTLLEDAFRWVGQLLDEGFNASDAFFPFIGRSVQIFFRDDPVEIGLLFFYLQMTEVVDASVPYLGIQIGTGGFGF